MIETFDRKVARLKRRVDDHATYRENLARLGAENRERIALVRSAYTRQPMGFWCDRCRRDFDAIGHLHSTLYVFNVDTGKTEMRTEAWPSAHYEALCPKGHSAVRYLTDKVHDPYFSLSEVVQRDRIRMERDLLQPSDPRFKYVYPEQWRRLETAREEQLKILNEHGE